MMKKFILLGVFLGMVPTAGVFALGCGSSCQVSGGMSASQQMSEDDTDTRDTEDQIEAEESNPDNDVIIEEDEDFLE